MGDVGPEQVIEEGDQGGEGRDEQGVGVVDFDDREEWIPSMTIMDTRGVFSVSEGDAGDSSLSSRIQRPSGKVHIPRRSACPQIKPH